MNCIEQKLLNTYQQFVDENGAEKPIAVNVLVRYSNGKIGEDVIFITKEGEPCLYGTNIVAHVNEIISCLSNLDFLPQDFDSRAEYEDEVLKYALTAEDCNYYFRNHRFDFSILDIISIHKMPANDNVYVIGHSEIVAGGIRYYGENSEYGQIYLDKQNIIKREGICYIAECSFEEDTNEGEDFVFLTPNNTFRLIEMGGVVTYDSARFQVMNLVFGKFPAFRKFAPFELIEKFIYQITDSVFNMVEGLSYSTYLEQIDMYEELTYFLENEFVAYVTKKLGVYEEDKDFREELFDVLGENCFMRRNFVPTNWDKLITKWKKQNH